uniref:Uncharacterized protein n=1 Tax=uncultured prokaryote TaxID=198431 RepID=A0A0H5Q0V4_9ZZZZ|nr:hypothetical protein [uncultured prokaryote]
MELKEEFKNIPKKEEKQEEVEKIEDLKRQIFELKKIIELQAEQIDNLKDDISILVGVFKKYDLVFSEKIETFTQQAKDLKLGSEELKKGMKAGIKEGAKEIIEDSTQSSLKSILESITTATDKANKKIEETGDSLAGKISLWDRLNVILVFAVAVIIILGIFFGWQFRGLRKETNERLYNMEQIQGRLSDLTTGEGKYWYSERDKKAYFGKIDDIKKNKENEKVKK